MFLSILGSCVPQPHLSNPLPPSPSLSPPLPSHLFLHPLKLWINSALQQPQTPDLPQLYLSISLCKAYCLGSAGPCGFNQRAIFKSSYGERAGVLHFWQVFIALVEDICKLQFQNFQGRNKALVSSVLFSLFDFTALIVFTLHSWQVNFHISDLLTSSSSTVNADVRDTQWGGETDWK